MSNTNNKAKIIAIATPKGGVGKTTSTSSIGGYLCTLGKDVLLVDLDYQANLTANYMANVPEMTVFDTFNERKMPIIHVKEHLDLLPSSSDMKTLDTLMDCSDDRFILAKALDKIRTKYDYILLDCPPSLGWATINAFTACDYLFVPVTADPKSYQGLGLLAPACYQAGTPTRIDGIFFTKYKKNEKLTQKIVARIKAQYGDALMNSTIRVNVDLSACADDMKDIYDYAHRSNGAQDYAVLCQEMLRRMGDNPSDTGAI